MEREAARDRGLGGALSDEHRGKMMRGSVSGGLARGVGSVSVFDGLTANRRSCVECGYTEAVMHFAFDSWQLSVPRLAVRIVCLRIPSLL